MQRVRIPTAKELTSLDFETLFGLWLQTRGELDELVEVSNAGHREFEKRVAQLAAPRFAEWMDERMSLGGITLSELADAYAELRVLHLRNRNGKWDRRSERARVLGQAGPPKKEMGRYRRGVVKPGAIVSYRIGRALEECFRARVNLTCLQLEVVATGDAFEESWNRPPATCGIDALIAAGHFHDAIGCIGEFVGRDESVANCDIESLKTVLKCELYSLAMASAAAISAQGRNPKPL